MKFFHFDNIQESTPQAVHTQEGGGGGGGEEDTSHTPEEGDSLDSKVELGYYETIFESTELKVKMHRVEDQKVSVQSDDLC